MYHLLLLYPIKVYHLKFYLLLQHVFSTYQISFCNILLCHRHLQNINNSAKIFLLVRELNCYQENSTVWFWRWTRIHTAEMPISKTLDVYQVPGGYVVQRLLNAGLHGEVFLVQGSVSKDQQFLTLEPCQVYLTLKPWLDLESTCLSMGYPSAHGPSPCLLTAVKDMGSDK